VRHSITHRRITVVPFVALAAALTAHERAAEVRREIERMRAGILQGRGITDGAIPPLGIRSGDSQLVARRKIGRSPQTRLVVELDVIIPRENLIQVEIIIGGLIEDVEVCESLDIRLGVRPGAAPSAGVFGPMVAQAFQPVQPQAKACG